MDAANEGAEKCVPATPAPYHSALVGGTASTSERWAASPEAACAASEADARCAQDRQDAGADRGEVGTGSAAGGRAQGLSEELSVCADVGEGGVVAQRLRQQQQQHQEPAEGDVEVYHDGSTAQASSARGAGSVQQQQQQQEQEHMECDGEVCHGGSTAQASSAKGSGIVQQWQQQEQQHVRLMPKRKRSAIEHSGTCCKK
eukprot:scaffold228120_cov12-Tisochrysis_lutea.AAC.1